jgi:hypothetical protein
MVCNFVWVRPVNIQYGCINFIIGVSNASHLFLIDLIVGNLVLTLLFTTLLEDTLSEWCSFKWNSQFLLKTRPTHICSFIK